MQDLARCKKGPFLGCFHLPAPGGQAGLSCTHTCMDGATSQSSSAHLKRRKKKNPNPKTPDHNSGWSDLPLLELMGDSHLLFPQEIAGIFLGNYQCPVLPLGISSAAPWRSGLVEECGGTATGPGLVPCQPRCGHRTRCQLSRGRGCVCSVCCLSVGCSCCWWWTCWWWSSPKLRCEWCHQKPCP